MATSDAAESVTDLLASLTRVDEWAYRLRMSVDVLLGHLHNQQIDLNPGDRIPAEVLFDALQKELDKGRGWEVEHLVRV
jgi:hypothetical protein